MAPLPHQSVNRQVDQSALEIEQQLAKYLRKQMPGYSVEIGDGDFKTGASSFIFINDDSLAVLYIEQGLARCGYDETVKVLEKVPWQSAVRDNPRHTVWCRRERLLIARFR